MAERKDGKPKKKPKKRIPAKAFRKVGRPTEYSKDMAERICKIIASENISVHRISDVYDDIPSGVTIFHWLTKYPEFLNQYEVAKLMQAEVFIDEVLDIADRINDPGRDSGTKVAARKLRIDTRLKVASKFNPKKYGEHIKQEVDARIVYEPVTGLILK